MLTVETLCALLGLEPHPVEGGYFVETLTPDTFSAIHRLASDEIFHFYLGDPVEMLQLWPDGSHRVVVIGPEVEAGQRPQVLVPRGIWQGARLRPGGRFALLGTTVAPGFDYADYQTADRAHLLTIHPTAHTLITALTPD